MEQSQEKSSNTEHDRYNEIQAKPLHKRTIKEREFVLSFETAAAAERKRAALISKVSEKAVTFGNAESRRIRRRVTDKVAALSPEAQDHIQKLMQGRKAELKDIDRMEKKVAKRIEKRFSKRRQDVTSKWNAQISEARKHTQERYKEYEQELNDSLEECESQVNAFLELVPKLSDGQLEQLLEGKAAEIRVGGVKEHIVIPGV